MSKKIYITLLIWMVLAAFALFAVTPALADNGGSTPTPCPQNYPCNISDLDGFLSGDCGEFFNPNPIGVVCEPIPTFNFEGLYYMTAIATEAVRNLRFQWPATHPTTVFDTEDCSTWGLFAVIDFDAGSPVFIDDSTQVSLDPYCPGGSGGNCDRFQICQLTRNSNLLSYLTHPITLFAGDIIIGFDDGVGDGDFDDLVGVVRPIEEPASAEPLVARQLFNTSEVNFFLLFNLKGDSFDVECAKLVDGEWVPAPGECTITTFSLEDLTIDGGTVEFAPFNLPWGASESPGCSYVRTRSGSVKRICQ